MGVVTGEDPSASRRFAYMDPPASRKSHIFRIKSACYATSLLRIVSTTTAPHSLLRPYTVLIPYILYSTKCKLLV